MKRSSTWRKLGTKRIANRYRKITKRNRNYRGIKIRMGNNSKLIGLKVRLIILFLLLTVGIFPQSIEDMYDLDFESYAKSYRGDWTKRGAMVLFSIDSMEIVNGKYPLKISSRRTMRHGGIYDEKRELLLSHTVILPSYVHGEICNVSINSKSENIENWKFEVRGVDESEEVLFSDSVYLESNIWKKSSMSFSLHNESIWIRIFKLPTRIPSPYI